MRTAAVVKAELKDIRTKYEEVIAKADPAHDAELREMDGKIETLLTEYSERAQAEQKASSNREAMNQIFAGATQAQPTTDGAKVEAKNANHTLGAQFINDPQFKSWYAGIKPSGTISDNIGVKSPVLTLESKALVTGLSSTSAGALVEPVRLAGITPLERDEITILDLITRIPVTTDAFEFVQVTTETNAAAPTLEATSVSTGAKPESSVALAVANGIIETIAHWIPITRRAASDAGQIMAYIDEFLRWGLRDELADQVLNGDGSTPNLEGLANTANTQSQAFSTDILETTRKARTLVRTVGKATPTAYVMNPADWETIDLLQDNEARYFFGGPARLGSPMLWGLPVVEEERQASGTAWVGDWREGLLFDREQTNVYMTDSHSDFFVRNILVILAELRAGFGVRRPKAFVEIDMASG